MRDLNREIERDYKVTRVLPTKIDPVRYAVTVNDVWGNPFCITVGPGGRWYVLTSLGSDGVRSADDFGCCLEAGDGTMMSRQFLPSAERP